MSDQITNEDAIYNCDGCGKPLTYEQIAYQNDDTGDDYCSECYEAIQDDQELLKQEK
jgi:hypothetical protein